MKRRTRSFAVVLLASAALVTAHAGVAGAGDRTGRLVRVVTDSPTGESTTSYLRVDSR